MTPINESENTMTNTERWECVGSVRGRCGVRHYTQEAAEQHCRLDDRQVKAGHGHDAYSDRRPVLDGQQHTVDSLIG